MVKIQIAVYKNNSNFLLNEKRENKERAFMNIKLKKKLVFFYDDSFWTKLKIKIPIAIIIPTDIIAQPYANLPITS